MLAIRMQRTGRKGHAMFRVVVQDSRVTPTSGKVVAMLGSYDPHAKSIVLDKEKAATYLKNGAQPSPRAVVLLKKEGVKLPAWVEIDTKKAGKLRNPEKLRKNQPKEAVKAEAPADQAAAATEPADAAAPAGAEPTEAVAAEATSEPETPAQPAASAEVPAAEQTTEPAKEPEE